MMWIPDLELTELLWEEGKDIWTLNDQNFFKTVKERSLRPHQVYAKDYSERRRFSEDFIDLNHDYRIMHELAHLTACKDENIMSPHWDFDHFIDFHGPFNIVVAVSELRVITLEAILGKHKKPANLAIGVLTELPGILEPGTISYYEMESICESVTEQWNQNRILDEVLRKYELIRKLRRSS